MAGKIRRRDIRKAVNTAKKIRRSKSSAADKFLVTLTFVAIVIGYAWFNGYFDRLIWSSGIPILTSPSFVEPAYVHGPEGGYEPTEIDYSIDKNYYRLAGTAVVEHDGLVPGEVRYGNLDVLGRATGAVAMLTKDSYEPGKERADSESGLPDPVGYRSVYCGLDVAYGNKVIGPSVSLPNGDRYSGWGYNRSHLIADSLGGAPILENLVTGTRMQNVGTNNVGGSGYGGMAFCEDIARDYLTMCGSDSTLYYAVTPVYIGEELLPRSVYVDMLSSDGSIDMHVEVYNTMKGYSINYSTGDVWES